MIDTLGSGLGQPWLPAAPIGRLVQLEPALMITGLVVGAYAFYRVFLGGLAEHRHGNLKRLFRNVAIHLLLATISFASYYGMIRWGRGIEPVERMATYLGFLSILSWTIVFVKVSRIALFEYLFLSNMRTGVPLLLVNIFTLLLTLILAGWLSTEIFGLRLTPLLATSAIFSLVLGLALQDTLGNLFAGIAIQFDKPYAIGDWIEVTVNDLKWVGQVQEISWRATVLISLTEELISVPNRLMGQTQISNFSAKGRPVIRSQPFRLPYGTPIEKAKKALLEAAEHVSGICRDPGPLVLITETTDCWMFFKLIYYIRDFGAHVVIGDRILTAGDEALRRAGIEIAPPRILVLNGTAGGATPLSNPGPGPSGERSHSAPSELRRI